MSLIIILLGLLLSLLGIIGLISPPPMVDLVKRFWGRPSGLYLAVVLRLCFGTVLLIAAEQTRFPLTMQVIGALSIIGALALPFIGFQRMQQLIRWWTAGSDTMIRLWAIFALLFGLFLAYACL